MEARVTLSGVGEESQSLTVKAYEALRDAILRNELGPGTLLSENSLAEQLHVSRTPVRAALKRLQEEGFVRIMPRRGVLVRNISAEDIVELYQMREALECYAMEFVPQYGDPDELAQLTAGLEQSVQWAETGAVHKINEVDTCLHRFVAKV